MLRTAASAEVEAATWLVAASCALVRTAAAVVVDSV